MSAEQFFAKDNITIESLIDIHNADDSELPTIDVTHVDFRASLIRNGNLPANTDPKIDEMKYYMDEALNLHERVETFQAKYEAKTDHDIRVHSAYGESYINVAERIFNEISALQESIVLLLVNSTHDNDVYLKISKIIDDVSITIDDLHTAELKTLEDRENYQNDIAQLSLVREQRASQQYEKTDEIRRLIKGVETQPAGGSIDSVSEYMDLQKGITPAPRETTIITSELSEEERVKAKKVCPLDLAEYDQILTVSQKANRDLGAFLNRDKTDMETIGKYAKKRSEYEHAKRKLTDESRSALESVEKYDEKLSQLIEALQLVDQNLSLGQNYCEGNDLREYQAIDPIRTTRLTSHFSKFSEDEIKNISQKFREYLEQGSLPDSASGNRYAKDLLQAYEITAIQVKECKRIAGSIDDDTVARINELKSSYGRDATVLNGIKAEMNETSGVTYGYLLNLAINYDTRLNLLNEDKKNRDIQVDSIRELDKDIRVCQKRILATEESALAHAAAIKSSKDAIRLTKQSYENKKQTTIQTNVDGMMQGPASNDIQDINDYYTQYDSNYSQYGGLNDPAKKELDAAVAQLEGSINSYEQELDGCMKMQKELRSRLVVLRNRRQEMVDRFEKLTSQILDHEHALSTLLKDGKYQSAIESYKVAEYMFIRIKNAYETLHEPKLAKDEIHLDPVDEPSLVQADVMSLDDMYEGSSVRSESVEAAEQIQSKKNRFQFPTLVKNARVSRRKRSNAMGVEV